MKITDEELLADTQEMDISDAKGSLALELPLPYQMILTVEIIDGPGAGTRIPFKSGRMIIGRSDADLVVEDRKISKKHAVIEAYSRNNICIRDLASTNGTQVNGIHVSRSKLSDGDLIKVGSVTLRFNSRDTQR